MKQPGQNGHERAALAILRNPQMTDGRPQDPLGRAQVLALLAIGDQLKEIRRSIDHLSKRDMVEEFASSISNEELSQMMVDGVAGDAYQEFHRLEFVKGD